jgi:hypothetical protein
MFTSHHYTQDSFIVLENGSHSSVDGVGTVYLNFTSGKNVQHVPTINKNLVRCSPRCIDGFKVVLEYNQEVASNHIKIASSSGKENVYRNGKYAIMDRYEMRSF